jgi:hypothetical protein
MSKTRTPASMSDRPREPPLITAMTLRNGPAPVKLWLDDVRVPPGDDWTWVRTVEEAIAVLASGRVVEASLDHDLDATDTRQGAEVCDWMARTGTWPAHVIRVHTSDNFASTYMCNLIERHGFVPVPGKPRWFSRGGPPPS